jgi:hypothetical protein
MLYRIDFLPHCSLSMSVFDGSLVAGLKIGTEPSTRTSAGPSAFRRPRQRSSASTPRAQRRPRPRRYFSRDGRGPRPTPRGGVAA